MWISFSTELRTWLLTATASALLMNTLIHLHKLQAAYASALSLHCNTRANLQMHLRNVAVTNSFSEWKSDSDCMSPLTFRHCPSLLMSPLPPRARPPRTIQLLHLNYKWININQLDGQTKHHSHQPSTHRGRIYALAGYSSSESTCHSGSLNWSQQI